MSIPLLDLPFPPTEEKLVTLYGIIWEQFKGIEAQLKDNPDVRLSYLSGILEIMSPIGEKHEEVKSTLSLLLDAYMREKGYPVLQMWRVHSGSTWVCFWDTR